MTPAPPITAQCTTRGCPTRYRSGGNRPCAMHSDDDNSMLARMIAFTELAAVPGEHSQADGGGDKSKKP